MDAMKGTFSILKQLYITTGWIQSLKSYFNEVKSMKLGAGGTPTKPAPTKTKYHS